MEEIISSQEDSVAREDELRQEVEDLENMRDGRKRIDRKDFARLINKRAISDFEMDELFM